MYALGFENVKYFLEFHGTVVFCRETFYVK